MVMCSVVMVTVGPKPVAGDTDAVLWHEHPTRVILKRHSNSSLGLSIITRQVGTYVVCVSVYLSVCLCMLRVCACVCVLVRVCILYVFYQELLVLCVSFYS